MLYLRRVDEVRSEMWNVFKKFRLESEADMVEENQVLMHLAHITDMGHDRQVENLREEADREELAHTRDSCTVDLDEGKRTGFHEVLEQDSVRDMLAGGNLKGADCA